MLRTGIVKRCAVTFARIQHTAIDVKKTCFQTFFKIYMMTQPIIQRRCVLKSYDELKAEMEKIQQQMVGAKKNELTNAVKEVKRLCKEFGFMAGMLKGSLAQGRGKK
jgi:predicted amino acid-binding ACT domain protein